jgi:hypothetical protein
MVVTSSGIVLPCLGGNKVIFFFFPWLLPSFYRSWGEQHVRAFVDRPICRSLATGFSRRCFNEKEYSSSSPLIDGSEAIVFFWKVLFVDTMLNLFMASKGILPTERLFVITDLTSDLLPVCIMNGIFMARQVIGSGEDSVARLVGSRVDPSTLVRAGVVGFDARKRSGLSVGFTSVL